MNAPEETSGVGRALDPESVRPLDPARRQREHADAQRERRRREPRPPAEPPRPAEDGKGRHVDVTA